MVIVNLPVALDTQKASVAQSSINSRPKNNARKNVHQIAAQNLSRKDHVRLWVRYCH
ncbi:unnamed protein product [Cylicocyclus nassatus]|uniref:Uncharacterized protein n=1 Tax=Cylicocyclus nassatus TaxID=53992 RepID=A0AA36HBC5_CYLNA|nr:unnamed protein product [Cylicocyclus nassatus]